MSQKGRLLSNIVILGISTAISKLAVFLMMPLYTANLAPAAFGTVEILINTAVLLMPLASLGVPEAVFRFVAGGENEYNVRAVGRKLLWLGLGLFFIILPFLWLFEVLRPYLLYLGVYVFLSVLHSYYAHVLRAEGEYLVYAIRQLFCTLVMVALASMFLTVWNLGVIGYLMAVFIADGVTALLIALYLFLRREKTVEKVEEHPNLFPAILRYALPLVPTAMLWWSLGYFDRYILLTFHGDVTVGLYAAAGKLPALLTFAAGIFLEAWHFSAIKEREEKRGERFDQMYGVLLPLLCFTVALMMLFSRPIVQRIFAPEYAGAARFVPFWALATLFSALSSFLGSVYVVKLRSGASFLTALFGAVVNIVLVLLLVPPLGADGAVLATLVSYVTLFLWRIWHCRTILYFHGRMHQLVLSVICLLVIGGGVLSGHMLLAVICTPLTLLPFGHDIKAGIRFLRQTVEVFLQKATKKKKRY